MFAIKSVETGKYAKHTGETNSLGYYVEYPWELVKEVEKAQQYTTLEHANEIAFWHLDMHKEWILVDVETGKE